MTRPHITHCEIVVIYTPKDNARVPCSERMRLCKTPALHYEVKTEETAVTCERCLDRMVKNTERALTPRVTLEELIEATRQVSDSIKMMYREALETMYPDPPFRSGK